MMRCGVIQTGGLTDAVNLGALMMTCWWQFENDGTDLYIFELPNLHRLYRPDLTNGNSVS